MNDAHALERLRKVSPFAQMLYHLIRWTNGRCLRRLASLGQEEQLARWLDELYAAGLVRSDGFGVWFWQMDGE